MKFKLLYVLLPLIILTSSASAIQFNYTFDNGLCTDWTTIAGTWTCTNFYLEETSGVGTNAISAPTTPINYTNSTANMTWLFNASMLVNGEMVARFWHNGSDTTENGAYVQWRTTAAINPTLVIVGGGTVAASSLYNDNLNHTFNISYQNSSGWWQFFIDNTYIGNTQKILTTPSDHWVFQDNSGKLSYDSIDINTTAVTSSNMSIASYSNNYTSDSQTVFNTLLNKTLQFNVTMSTVSGSDVIDYVNWTVNATDKKTNALTLNYSFNTTNLTVINFTAHNTTKNYNVSVQWNVTGITYNISLISPTNGSSVSNPVTLKWREWESNAPYGFQVATDPNFLNIVSSGSGSVTNENITTSSLSLSNGIKYFWRAKNSTGAYLTPWNFTTTSIAATAGMLNITALDEKNLTTVHNFTVQLYNSTVVLTKATTSGWANFTSSEVISGQYFIQVIPNSSYASRSVLAMSPNNVTVYLPATTNTIDTIAFYILDYTNLYPFSTSNLTITKNNSIMHSAYFDADAKVAAYLIRGDSYTITVYNGKNMQQWGNYISTGSGNVEVVLMDIGVNTSKYAPFNTNLTWTNTDITLQWNDIAASLISLNYTIYKGSSKDLVHNLQTTISSGQSQYTVINNSDVYYVYVNATTTNGVRETMQIIEYRAGTLTDNWNGKSLWVYGTFVMPTWVYGAFSIIVIMLLGGTFGALHRGEGGIITSVMALFFWYKGWLTLYGAGSGFLVGLVVFAVLYHLESKRRQPGVY